MITILKVKLRWAPLMSKAARAHAQRPAFAAWKGGRWAAVAVGQALSPSSNAQSRTRARRTHGPRQALPEAGSPHGEAGPGVVSLTHLPARTEPVTATCVDILEAAIKDTQTPGFESQFHLTLAVCTRGSYLTSLSSQLLLLDNGENHHRVSVRWPSGLLLPQDVCPPGSVPRPSCPSPFIQHSGVCSKDTPSERPPRPPAETAPHPPVIPLTVLATPRQVTELSVF